MGFFSCSALKPVTALAGMAMLVTSARAQGTSDFFNITEFPNQQKANVSQYLSEARNIAGDDIYPHFAHRCILNQVYPTLSSLGQSAGFVKPARPFDELYFVGQSAVSAWAVDTGDGVVVFDALNNAEEVQEVLVPGLESFGFSPSDIKLLIITHEHRDHYGGARYIQDTYGTEILASEAAWNALANATDTPPSRSRTVADGESITIGNATFQFYVTPGHTAGCVSTIFSVHDHGEDHVAAIYGGLGIPSSVSGKVEQINSLQRFAGLAETAGVDVLLANHQLQDRSIYHFDILESRTCAADGTCNTGNPFVVGTDAYVRYLQVQESCIRVGAARSGQSLPSDGSSGPEGLVGRDQAVLQEGTCSL